MISCILWGTVLRHNYLFIQSVTFPQIRAECLLTVAMTMNENTYYPSQASGIVDSEGHKATMLKKTIKKELEKPEAKSII